MVSHLRTFRNTKLWRYRVSSYRIVCQIQDDVVTVLIVRIAKRDEVYQD